jgi:hypothetical protein
MSVAQANGIRKRELEEVSALKSDLDNMLARAERDAIRARRLLAEAQAAEERASEDDAASVVILYVSYNERGKKNNLFPCVNWLHCFFFFFFFFVSDEVPEEYDDQYENDDIDEGDQDDNDEIDDGDIIDEDDDDNDDEDDDDDNVRNVFNGSGGKRRMRPASTSTSSTFEEHHIRKQSKPASAAATAAATPATPKSANKMQLLKSPFVQEVESIQVAQDRIAALSASIASVADPVRRLQLLEALRDEQSQLMRRAEQLHAAQTNGPMPSGRPISRPISRRSSLAVTSSAPAVAVASTTSTGPVAAAAIADAAAALVPMSSFDIRGMLDQLSALEADWNNGHSGQQQQQQQQLQQQQQQQQQQLLQVPLPPPPQLVNVSSGQQVHYSAAPREESRQQYGEMKLIANGSPSTPLLSSKNRRAAELFRTPSFAVTDEGVPAWLFAGRQQRSVRRAPPSQRSFAAEPLAYYPPRAPHTLGLSGSMEIRAELSHLVSSLSAAECDGALLLLRTVYDIGSANQGSIGDLCADVASLLQSKHQQPVAHDELDRSFDEMDQQRVAIVDSVRKEAHRNGDGDDDGGGDDDGDGNDDGSGNGDNNNNSNNNNDDDDDDVDDKVNGANDDDLPALTGAVLDAARRGVGGNVQYDTTRAVLEARAMLSKKKFASYETAATVRREHALRNKNITDGLAQLNDTVISLSPGDAVRIRGAHDH